MQMPYLQMQSVHGKIGMQSNRPQMQIQQKNAELTIKQEHGGTLRMSTRPSKLHIDQTEAFADANLKGPLRSSNEFTGRTKSEVAQYIAKTNQQGDQMMKIENGGNAIPRIAKANSELYPERELNIGYMPRNAFRVKFNYQPSELSINVSSSQPEINVRRNDPKISIPKWQSEVYVRQKNKLSIQAVGLQVNLQR